MISTLERLRTPQAPCSGLFPSSSINQKSAETTRVKTPGRETQDYPAKSRLHSAKPTSNKDGTPYRKPQEKLSTVPTVSQIPTQAPRCSTTYPHTGEHAP
ncbi:hypothetical protein CSPX01_01731 [Colletotrichum filicis]|nr:hypothetical protein CSPX01_01731 [Colletotrichum filicis]